MRPIIRVARECIPGYVWTTDIANGTLWHGNGMLLLSELQKQFNFDFKIVHKFPKYNDSDGIHYIAKGTVQSTVCIRVSLTKSYLISTGLSENYADVDPDLYQFFYDQSKFVDHSTPIFFNDVSIVSTRLPGEVDLFGGTFDFASFVLICLSIISVAMVLALLFENKIMDSTFSVFKIILKQNLDKQKKRQSITEKGFLAFEMLALSTIGMMYSSIVISILSVPSPQKQIDSLYDLTFSPKRIFINKYIKNEILSKSVHYDDLKDRIDIWDFGASYNDSIEKIYNGLLKQTHVSIVIRRNVIFQYRSAVSSWLRCKLPYSSLYFSRQSLSTFHS